MIKVEAVIVGAGPAGIAAAIQLQRQGVPFVLLEPQRIGGALHNAHQVENYPGFPAGLPGTELAEYFKESLLWHEIKPVRDRVVRIGFEAVTGLFRVHCARNAAFLAEHLILATGTVARQPTNLPGWREAYGKRCFTEVTEMLDLEGQRIVVLGSGSNAFDYALTLAKHNQVAVVLRGGESRARPQLKQRVQANRGIRVGTWMELARVEVLDEQLRLHWRITGSEGRKGSGQPHIDTCDHVVAAIGREATLPEFSITLEKLQDKLFREGRIQRVGDVAHDDLRQTGVAVGEGIRAAMHVGRLVAQRKKPRARG